MIESGIVGILNTNGIVNLSSKLTKIYIHLFRVYVNFCKFRRTVKIFLWLTLFRRCCSIYNSGRNSSPRLKPLGFPSSKIMKKELLEYIIRKCVKEVLANVSEADDTAGAPAPPASGQGTADTLAIPPASPQGAPKPAKAIKGVWFVDPKKALQPDYKGVPLQDLKPGDQGNNERRIYNIAARSGGPRVMLTISARQKVDAVLSGKVPFVYLYVGTKPWSPSQQSSPEASTGTPSDDSENATVSIHWAPTLQAAKSLSVPSGVSAEHPQTAFNEPEPGLTTPQTGPQTASKTQAPSIDESNSLKNMVSSMIGEALREARRK